MKEELENKSMELLQWLEQAVKSTANFASDQIPLFVQELLTYNFTMSLIAFIMGIVGLIATIYITYKFIKWMIKEDDFDLFPVLALSVILTMGFLGMCVTHTDWIKIKLAPRVYLLDYVKDLVKNQ